MRLRTDQNWLLGNKSILVAKGLPTRTKLLVSSLVLTRTTGTNRPLRSKLLTLSSDAALLPTTAREDNKADDGHDGVRDWNRGEHPIHAERCVIRQ